MNLSAPTVPVFLVSAIVVIVAILITLNIIPAFGVQAFWVAVIGYIILMLGALLKGL